MKKILLIPIAIMLMTTLVLAQTCKNSGEYCSGNNGRNGNYCCNGLTCVQSIYNATDIYGVCIESTDYNPNTDILMYPPQSDWYSSSATLDLYGLFVENVFGGFWISVFGFILLFFIIMVVLGGMNWFSWFSLSLLFSFAMVLGYGYTAITVLFAVGLLYWFWNSLKNYFGGT